MLINYVKSTMKVQILTNDLIKTFDMGKSGS